MNNPAILALRSIGLYSARPLRKTAADQSTSLIALFIPAADSNILCQQAAHDLSRLLVGEVLPPGELHLSLAILPDASQFANALTAMTIVALNNPHIIPGTISGYGVFKQADQDVLYASFDSATLSSFRQELCDVLDRRGVDYSREHGFTPHITLAYLPQDTPIGQLNLAPLDIEFDGLTLASDDRRVTIGLESGTLRLGKTARRVVDQLTRPRFNL